LATLSKLDSGTGTVTMAGLVIGQVFLGAGTPAQATVGGVINRP
jgi:tetrahydromethanopterin S-methyltransferase subunit F